MGEKGGGEAKVVVGSLELKISSLGAEIESLREEDCSFGRLGGLGGVG